jgi:hypothetical protein
MVVSMSKDEIIAMLRAACDKDKVDPEQNGFWVIHTPELEAFAKLVAQHEREACAKIADIAEPYKSADLIRARGQA